MSDSERNVLEAIAELPLVKLLTKLQIGLLQDMVYDDLSVTAAAAKRGVTQAKARREVAKLRAVISTELEKLDKQECE